MSLNCSRPQTSTMILCKVLAVALTLIGSVSSKNMALETNEVADYFISSKVNFFIDICLKHYTSKLIEENKTQIEVQGFEEKFSTKILTLLIEGAFVVEDGLAGNISSLHRTGDAVMEMVGSDIYLTAHLGLGQLQVDFNNYDISLLGSHQKGKIHATVGANSLFLKIKLQVNPTCVVSLESLKIEQLENIEVDITNLGIFENLTDDITSWIVNEIIKSYRNYVEVKLYPALSAAIREADLCHYIPH